MYMPRTPADLDVPFGSLVITQTGMSGSMLRSLRHINKVGISASDCGAIAIVDDEYRVITSAPADGGFRPYVLRTYRDGGRLFEEELTGGAASGRLEDLLALNGKLRKP